MVYLRHVAHAYHKNICKGVSTWENKDSCRDFENEEIMTETLIKNINDNVGQDDILYHCGDFAMGGRESIYKFRKRLIVKTIHLIGGNHDQHIRNNAIVKTDDGYINAQNLFTTYNELLDKKINGQNMVLCHYQLRVWHKGSKGSWMLGGHSHGNLPPYIINNIHYKTKDIGIDTHPEFRPYHYDELAREFGKDKYNNLTIDHHK